MTTKVKPNAAHRIVEGEVVAESIDDKIERGREYSKSKADKSQEKDTNADLDMNAEQDPESILKDLDPNAKVSEIAQPKQSFIAKYINTILWLILFAVVISVLYATRPDSDWQIQKINELQQDVLSLEEQNQSLSKQVFQIKSHTNDSIKTQIEQMLASNNSLNKAPATAEDSSTVVNNAQIENVKQAVDTKITELQQQFETLAQNTGEKLEQAAEDLQKQMADKLAEQLAKTPTTVQPSQANGETATQEQTTAQIQTIATEQFEKLENSFKTQVEQMSGKLADLLAFKEQQTALNDAEAEKQAEQSKQAEPQKTVASSLNSLQIQQWIVELNTQWMMHGRVAETRQQLLSLEQAATLSNFSYINQLVRLIGQDLAYLEQLEQRKATDPKPKVSDLRAKLKTLGASQVVINQQAQAAQEAEMGAFDKLLQSLDKLVTVKKRESDDEMLQVNKLLLNDVLKQRLALLVDRLQWGVDSQSKALVDTAVNDIKAFLQQYYEAESTDFDALLVPFTNLKFDFKQPLSIMRLDEAIK